MCLLPAQDESLVEKVNVKKYKNIYILKITNYFQLKHKP